MTMMLDAPVSAVPALTRVLLVEGHQLAGVTLAGRGLDVARSAGASLAEIVEEARAQRPDLVVLDLEVAGVGSAPDLIRPLVELGATVLVLTGVTDRLELARCLEAGAVGVARKAESFSSVLDKIRRAADGERVTTTGHRVQYQKELDEHRRAQRRRLVPFESLTPRERDVLAKIVAGRRAAEIAGRCHVSLPTVRTQIRSILQKLDVNSQMAAATMARNAGWSPAEDHEATGQAEAIR